MIPMLLRRIADVIVSEEVVTDHLFVRSELRQIGRLRRAQGYGAEEVAEGFDGLHDVLLARLEDMVRQLTGLVSAEDVVRASRRLGRAIDASG